jgi:hypothetical protein
MAECPGSEEECRVGIIEAFTKLQKDNAVSEVTKLRTKLRESMDKARRPVKEITLLGLVPGRCRVCKRLGL